jgi:hypothetical protein
VRVKPKEVFRVVEGELRGGTVYVMDQRYVPNGSDVLLSKAARQAPTRAGRRLIRAQLHSRARIGALPNASVAHGLAPPFQQPRTIPAGQGICTLGGG